MSIADVLSRMATIGQLAEQSVTPTAAPPAQSSASPTSFADVLATSGGSSTSSAAAAQQLALETAMSDPLLSGDTFGSLPTAAPAFVAPGSSVVGTSGGNGPGVLAAAESQLGVAEQPPGSNDGPQLALYRSAVEGAQPGEPWCAYFASWAAAQGGEPLGAYGQGLGSVAEITDWAQSTGRLLPPTAMPTAGDLILFGDRHVGVVESVNPDGSLTTVEGNYANAVTRVNRSPAEATGYVAL